MATDDDPLFGRFKRLVLAIVGSMMKFRTLYRATVIRQVGDRSLEVKLDKPPVPWMTNCIARLGIPGSVVSVGAGSRCIVAFADADGKQPIVISWEDSTLTELNIASGTNFAARVGDKAEAYLVTGGSASPAPGAIISSWPDSTTALAEIAVLNGASPGSAAPAPTHLEVWIVEGSRKILLG